MRLLLSLLPTLSSTLFLGAIDQGEAAFLVPPIHTVHHSFKKRAGIKTNLQMSNNNRYSGRRGKRLHVQDEWYKLALEARDCARSETSTADECEDYLNKMLGIEAGCIAGTVPPSSDVCSDPLWFAEIISDLRLRLGYDGPVEYDAKRSHESEGHVQRNLDDKLHP
uniref:Uncharacterized protein n=1 Tax=Leptocylindrus danicus TaxID=163516 RepID=A0A7S2PRH0_9STRA|mmetsp:Transcript_9531/g.14330  ORF Transcript_9531/g.14330 Transcript_9531/m.14330 type:complete len:166 (+) Transcript_9531:190-687(+)|eukprot:CAMPEP_0116018134 /NCGR_PEP_ID=MMETSP0321-20121206/8462_1 /TAXON_ID=163516 /ORGANISM="Leptocylindrus danicus var. danicus, Strain B650" /LENGTH=165 /DNA_ID=CAMNT_0003488459 /DNA_START=184 /DNA_END=681 /DNA_ORIENTATION=-